MRRKRKKYTGVLRRGNNSFRINYYVNGKRIEETVKASSEAEASIVRHKRLANADMKITVIKEFEPVTFEQAFERYLINTDKLLDPNTQQRSQCVYNHFIDYKNIHYPQALYIHQVNGEIAKRYKEYMLALPGKSASGINTDIDKLRAIFQKLIEIGFIEVNPFYLIEKIPKRLAKPQKKHLPTDYEIKQILDYTANNLSYREITRFLVMAGRRIEEACLYEKRDVLTDSKGNPIQIIVRPEIAKTKETGEVTLDEELSTIVKDALLKNPEVKYLFTNQDKRKVAQNTYRLYLKNICEKKKLHNISPHCFRYYVCQKLLDAGVNLRDAMAITGHSDIKSFMSYVKTTRKGRLKALAVTSLQHIK